MQGVGGEAAAVVEDAVDASADPAGDILAGRYCFEGVEPFGFCVSAEQDYRGVGGVDVSGDRCGGVVAEAGNGEGEARADAAQQFRGDGAECLGVEAAHVAVAGGAGQRG